MKPDESSSFRLNSRPRMLKELAAAYGVDCRTFKHWLRKHPAIPADHPRAGYYFTIDEINVIISAIGEP